LTVPEQNELSKLVQNIRRELDELFKRNKNTKNLMNNEAVYDKWKAICKILAVRHRLKDLYQFVDLMGLKCSELKAFLPFLLHNI
jgi:hypothetical protein